MAEVLPDNANAYFEFLKDLSADDIANGIRRHVNKNKWFPAISEIRAEAEYSEPPYWKPLKRTEIEIA